MAWAALVGLCIWAAPSDGLAQSAIPVDMGIETSGDLGLAIHGQPCRYCDYPIPEHERTEDLDWTCVTTDDGVVECVEPGGAVQYRFLDGSVLTVYPDGHSVAVSASGMIVIMYPDGVRVTYYTDGRVVVTYPDGVVVTILPNGNRQIVYPDGTVVYEMPDGCSMTENPDGSTVYDCGDHVIIVEPDGTCTKYDGDGGTTDCTGWSLVTWPVLEASELELGTASEGSAAEVVPLG